MLAVDVDSYLPYDLLVKMDIATMAHSLEARSPLLDHEVMEFCARLPGRFKQRGLNKKYLLKRIGEKLLPPGHVRRPKRGFAVPVGAWMREDLRGEVRERLLAPRARIHAYVQPAAVRRLLDQHLSGQNDFTPRLWALLWLELWHEEFIHI
jgi:asparagine synthase (glutamine-hydrolysing)